MRTVIDYDPFSSRDAAFWGQGFWPADWIEHPDASYKTPAVFAYRKRFTLNAARTVRVHVTADERYDLFLDGSRVGRGSERGDHNNWFFETYDFDLPAGDHLFVARTWSMGVGSPYAQMSTRPGFFLLAENEDETLLNTGRAAWEVRPLPGYSTIESPMTYWAGHKWGIDGTQFAWGFEQGDGDSWIRPTKLCQGRSASFANEDPAWWLLRPSTLPAMIDKPVPAGRVRHVEALGAGKVEEVRVMGANHLPSDADEWQSMLVGAGTVTVAAGTRMRVIVDLENYFCSYPKVVVTGGTHATIRMHFAESLYEVFETQFKGNRNEIEGKLFVGTGDRFLIADGKHSYEHLWWEAGRYYELLIETADLPLSINAVSLTETRYPHEFTARFEASDARLADVIPIGVRTLEMCSHETYFDCPYYEQLMYVGDTRLEVLTTYALTPDDRLPRKAVSIFDKSRRTSGMTQARYPNRILQVIPPFSLWWIAMVHDYAFWRADPEFVKSMMPGVRAVIEAWRAYITVDGLVGAPDGWNYIDWVPAWEAGIPPDGASGISGVLNWHFAMVLRLAAELEVIHGETELAARNIRTADTIAQAADAAFWCDDRGLYADDLAHTRFSEHSQCLALLGDNVPASKRDRVATALFADPDIERTTIYFSYYLFETYRIFARTELLLDRLGMWFDLQKNGFTTTFESPEPCRSDCHAWGAHPIFHYFATLIGIRPAAPSFAKVRIEPQPGDLAWLRGSMPHPAGDIVADLQFDGGEITGSIGLPDRVSGELVFAGRTQRLHSGTQIVNLEK